VIERVLEGDREGREGVWVEKIVEGVCEGCVGGREDCRRVVEMVVE
jgi:hypothetical protein